MFHNRPKPYDHERAEPSHHYEVALVEWERELLLNLLDLDRKPTIKERRYLARKLRDGIRREGPPLPVASLDWRRLERVAKDRGSSVAELIFDNPPPDKAA